MVTIILSEDKFSQSIFDEFCKRNNLNSPPHYVQFTQQNNDSELEVNIVQGFDECCVRYFYGTTAEMYSNIDDVFECYKVRMPTKCIPIADAEGGNQVCMSLNPETYGKVYFWDHETMDVDEGEECQYSIETMTLMADSFDEFINKIIAC